MRAGREGEARFSSLVADQREQPGDGGPAGESARRPRPQWNDPKSPPPDLSQCAALGARSGVRVTVKRFARNTLLNRYAATELMGPRVLLQDDDVRYGARAVRTLSLLSALFPKSVVGVNGRLALAYASGAPATYLHSDKEPGAFLEDATSRSDGENTSRFLYNMATGTTSVLRRSAIAKFASHVPQKSIDYISSHKPTCEDITLHFLAANLTQQPPLWFQFHSTDGGELDKRHPDEPASDGGVQMHLTTADWSTLRAACVDRVAADFGRFPLVQTNCRMAYRHADPAVPLPPNRRLVPQPPNSENATRTTSSSS